MSATSSLPPASTETRISAVAPPPGVVPNFDNPTDAGAKVTYITANACMATIAVMILVRAYVKIFILRQVILEDGESCRSILGILRNVTMAWLTTSFT